MCVLIYVYQKSFQPHFENFASSKMLSCLADILNKNNNFFLCALLPSKHFLKSGSQLIFLGIAVGIFWLCTLLSLEDKFSNMPSSLGGIPIYILEKRWRCFKSCVFVDCLLTFLIFRYFLFKGFFVHPIINFTLNYFKWVFRSFLN